MEHVSHHRHWAAEVSRGQISQILSIKQLGLELIVLSRL